MGTSKHVGRVAMRGKVGRARVGQAVGRAPTPARAPTDVIRPGTAEQPVFVDASGRRRRRLRRTTYAIGAVLLLALLILWLSQFGGGVGPR